MSIDEKKLSTKNYYDSNPNHIALCTDKGVCSAEVGTLVLVFEKSAAEPKSNLLKCKSIVNIVIFNVRTLNTIELMAFAAKHNVDIICIQKTYCNSKVSKVADQSRGWPECSLCDSYYTKV